MKPYSPGPAKLLHGFSLKVAETEICDGHKHCINHAELNDKKEVLSWFEQGFQEKAAWMVYLNSDLRYDSLRSEPRSQDLLRRMAPA